MSKLSSLRVMLYVFLAGASAGRLSADTKSLTLTPEATARGFSLSLFADHFPVYNTAGPLGIAFLETGEVLVVGTEGGTVYDVKRLFVFSSNSDGQHADTDARGVPITFPGEAPGSRTIYDLAVVGTRIFGSYPRGVAELTRDGRVLQDIPCNSCELRGLVADRLNGHFYSSGIGIWDIDPVSKRVTGFPGTTTNDYSNYFDGASISPDGKTVYVAGNVMGHILGYDVATKSKVFDSGQVPGGIDGLAVGTGVLNGKLYVNTNSGTVYEIDLATKARTLLASNGSRGDFVKVSPDGTLLLTQTDSIYRLRPPPGGGFEQPLPVIDNFIARFKDSSADLAWKPVSGTTPASYNEYRRTDLSGQPQLVRSGLAVANLTDTGLTNGTTYYYTMRWVDQNGTESGDSTEMSATPTSDADKANGKTPPTILSPPNTRVTVGQQYTYTVRTSDPDPGDVLKYSLNTAPTGMSIDTVSGTVQWNPTATQVGKIPVRIRVEDQLGHFASQAFNVNVVSQSTIVKPVITSIPRPSGIVGQVYLYQLVVTDTNTAPVLHYSLSTAPSEMSIDARSGLVRWTPTKTIPQSVVVRVEDQYGAFTEQSFVLTVDPAAEPPKITSDPITSAAAGRLYQYAVTAQDPKGLALTYSLPTAPPGMVINPSTGLITWTPIAAQAGATHVVIQVQNSAALSSKQEFDVGVALTPNRPPVITSVANPNATVGQQYTYQVTANDPDGDPVAYSFVSAPVGMSLDARTGLIRWTPASADTGDWDITFRVQDPGPLVATQSFKVHVARAYPVPTITVTSPAPGSILNRPVNVVASISDPSSGNPPISWTVDLQRSDNKETRRIGNGSGATQGGVIARIDPTLISDNTWNLVVTVSREGQTDTFPFRYEVSSGNFKLGNFKTTFVDSSIPVAGIAMVISREYDSLDTSTGEFGAGWRLGLPGRVVDSASEDPLEPFTPKTRVYVTRPDGKREGFTFDPIPPPFFQVFWRPRFKPDPGVTDTLEVSDTVLLNTVGGFVEALGGPYNPYLYGLKTKEGVEYIIDEEFGLRSITDRNGNVLEVTPDGLKSKATGLSLPFERDGEGRITRITEPGGGSVRYAYDTQGNLVSSYDQMGNETKYSYEDSHFVHYLTKVEDPLHRPVTRNVYNPEGRLKAQCDANGDVTTLAGCVTFNPDVNANTQSIINARGFRTDLILDDRGNVLTEQRWLDATNHLDTVRTYDSNNNLLTTTDPAGNITSSTYDNRGDVLTQTDSGKHTRTLTYGTCDQPVTDTDPEGNTTTYTYNEQCNIRTVKDPLGGTTEYQYNTKGQRTELIDAVGNKWQWTYDGLGFPAAVTDPFGRSTVLKYSQLGELKTRIDRNERRIDLEYDAAHRMIRETWASGRSITYKYDVGGQLTDAVDPLLSLSNSFTAAGQLETERSRWSFGSLDTAVNYIYDQDTNVVGVQDSLGGTTNYLYDGLGRTSRITQSGTGVQPKRFDMTYDSTNLLTSMRRFDGVTDGQGVANTMFLYQCGGCSQLSSIHHLRASDNSTITKLDFARDRANNIVRSIDSDGSHDYAYDAAGRLVAANHSNNILPTEEYTYDLVGNRQSSHISSSYRYSYQSTGAGNRLVRDQQFDYTYDNEGNLIKKIRRTDAGYFEFAYDFRNRIISAVEKTSQNVEIARSEYEYDALNRRVHLRENGNDLYFAYDGLNPILALSKDGSVVTRRLYSRSADDVLADEHLGETRWFLKDQIGSVRDLITSKAARINHYAYDSFGRVLESTNQTVQNQLLYTGREFDSVSGLGYFRARYYDPSQGRFVSEDPLQFESGDPTLYVYTQGNPLRGRDPSGTTLEEDALLLQRSLIVGAFQTTFVDLACGKNNDYSLTLFGARLGVNTVGNISGILGSFKTLPFTAGLVVTVTLLQCLPGLP